MKPTRNGICVVTTVVLLAALIVLPTGCGSTPGRLHDQAASIGTEPLTASPLTATDLDGGVVDVGQIIDSGETVALVFWQSWCGSCRREAPAMVRAARDYGDAIRFFGVVPGPDNVVDDAEIRRVAGEWGLVYPTLRDREMALTRKFGVEGTPTVVVIGPGRNVLYRDHTSPSDWSAFAKSR